MSDDNDVYTPAQAVEWRDGYGARENDEVHPHGATVQDEKVSRFLSVMKETYQPEHRAERPDMMPGQAENLELFRQCVRMEGTDTYREAMDVGDMPTLRHFTGDTNQRADISGIKAIGKIDELVTQRAPVIIILGEMGHGKTDFSGLLGQRWDDHQPEDRVIASNIKSLQETTDWVDSSGNARDGWIANFGNLKQWVKQDGDPLQNYQRPKLFIGDEFSISASGYGESGYDTATKMGPLVYLIRKYNGALIYIAHGPKSIHPLLWRVGTIVKKTSQKKAVVADKIKSGSVADVEQELEGIPPTDWRFSTDDTAPWSWNEYPTPDEKQEDELSPDEAVRSTAIWTVIRCKEQGLSDRETAKFVPYSHQWVNTRWNEYTDEGMHRQTVDSVEAVVA